MLGITSCQKIDIQEHKGLQKEKLRKIGYHETLPLIRLLSHFLFFQFYTVDIFSTQQLFPI